MISTCLLSLALSAPVLADPQRQATQSRLKEVEQQIAQLQSGLEKNRQQQQAGQEQLKAMDLAIQESALRNRQLKQDIAQLEGNVSVLQQRQQTEIDLLGQREGELGTQMVAAWQLMRQSRLKLILNQDQPARVNRLLAYYDHLSEAQGAQIKQLRHSLKDLENVTAQLETELSALSAVEASQQQAQAGLEQQRAKQLQWLQQLQADWSSAELRLTELTRNRADLEALLEKLDDALADIPSDIGDRSHPRALKGQLPMPVQGPVAKAFGQMRAAGLRWQGWMIGTQAGTEIRAVAYGRVAYANWLRGYGLLLIIDHGDGFMSLYGHNESLLAEVGDWVSAGTPIASSGQQGNQQAGLYFELRSDGAALDPAVWIKRR